MCAIECCVSVCVCEVHVYPSVGVCVRCVHMYLFVCMSSVYFYHMICCTRDTCHGYLLDSVVCNIFSLLKYRVC